MPSTVVCRDLTFTWPSGDPAITSLDCAFPDHAIGLVGRNGVGKSTLLKIIAGELAATAGSVSRPERVGYLPQQITLESARTVADVLGVSRTLAALAVIDVGEGRPEDFVIVGDDWDVTERSAAMLGRFGLADLGLDRPIGTLSGGEVILLALAALFLDQPDLLLLDEPTNNLDLDARRRLYAAIGSWRGHAIVVSHDRELLDLMGHVGEMREGSIRFFGGNFTAYEEVLAVEQDAAARGARAAESDLKRQQRELAETRVKLDRRQRFASSQAGNIPKMSANFLKNKSEGSAAKLREVIRTTWPKPRPDWRQPS